jgi:hypothetical protein
MNTKDKNKLENIEQMLSEYVGLVEKFEGLGFDGEDIVATGVYYFLGMLEANAPATRGYLNILSMCLAQQHETIEYFAKIRSNNNV